MQRIEIGRAKGSRVAAKPYRLATPRNNLIATA